MTDPRIFLAERDGIYLDVAGGPFPVEELRDRARRGDHRAADLLRVGDEFVARRILIESSPFRLALKVVQVDDAYGMIARAHELERPLGYDVEAQPSAIRAKKQGVVTRAAEFASKAGSVFAEADDQVLTVKVKALFKSQFGGMAKAVHKSVLNMLRRRHAQGLVKRFDFVRMANMCAQALNESRPVLVQQSGPGRVPAGSDPPLGHGAIQSVSRL